MSVADFRSWCEARGCRNALHLTSVGKVRVRSAWHPDRPWDGRDPRKSFFDEFGFYLEGLHDPPIPSQAGIDPALWCGGFAVSNHEAANMAQLDLGRLVRRGDNFFGLADPAAYQVTFEDGLLCIVLEDPESPDSVLFDGVIWRALHGAAPVVKPAQPPAAPAPAPEHAAPPLPTRPGPVPALAPAYQRVLDLEGQILTWAQHVKLPDLTRAWLGSVLVDSRGELTGALRDIRRARRALLGDPRPLPVGEE